MIMNDGRSGRPYSYSDSLMLIMLAVKEHFGLPYRQTEGFTRLLGGIWGASFLCQDMQEAEEAQCALGS